MTPNYGGVFNHVSISVLYCSSNIVAQKSVCDVILLKFFISFRPIHAIFIAIVSGSQFALTIDLVKPVNIVQYHCCCESLSHSEENIPDNFN